jgi:hypothetical protein
MLARMRASGGRRRQSRTGGIPSIFGRGDAGHTAFCGWANSWTPAGGFGFTTVVRVCHSHLSFRAEQARSACVVEEPQGVQTEILLSRRLEIPRLRRFAPSLGMTNGVYWCVLSQPHQTVVPSTVDSHFVGDTTQLVPSRAKSRVGFSLPKTTFGPNGTPCFCRSSRERSLPNLPGRSVHPWPRCHTQPWLRAKAASKDTRKTRAIMTVLFEVQGERTTISAFPPGCTRPHLAGHDL